MATRRMITRASSSGGNPSDMGGDAVDEDLAARVASAAKANGEGKVDYDTPTLTSGSERATGIGGAPDAAAAAAAAGSETEILDGIMNDGDNDPLLDDDEEEVEMHPPPTMTPPPWLQPLLDANAEQNRLLQARMWQSEQRAVESERRAEELMRALRAQQVNTPQAGAPGTLAGRRERLVGVKEKLSALSVQLDAVEVMPGQDHCERMARIFGLSRNPNVFACLVLMALQGVASKVLCRVVNTTKGQRQNPLVKIALAYERAWDGARQTFTLARDNYLGRNGSIEGRNILDVLIFRDFRNDGEEQTTDEERLAKLETVLGMEGEFPLEERPERILHMLARVFDLFGMRTMAAGFEELRGECHDDMARLRDDGSTVAKALMTMAWTQALSQQFQRTFWVLGDQHGDSNPRFLWDADSDARTMFDQEKSRVQIAADLSRQLEGARNKGPKRASSDRKKPAAKKREIGQDVRKPPLHTSRAAGCLPGHGRAQRPILDIRVGRDPICSVWFQTGNCERPACRMHHEWVAGAEQAARDYAPPQAIREHFEQHGVDFKTYFEECLKGRMMDA